MSERSDAARPRVDSLDSIAALLADPYGWISARCDALGSDLFGARIALQDTLCPRGGDAAALFYDGARFRRDHLIVATGARHSYFGHDEWERYASGLESIEDATAIRRRLLLAFERAEGSDDPRDAQQGRHVAKVLRARLAGRPTPPFRYRHAGDLATIGRGAGVVEFPRLHLKGAIAWWLWGIAHVYFLIGVAKPFRVSLRWLWEYSTYRRGARPITGVETRGVTVPPPPHAGKPPSSDARAVLAKHPATIDRTPAKGAPGRRGRSVSGDDQGAAEVGNAPRHGARSARPASRTPTCTRGSRTTGARARANRATRSWCPNARDGDGLARQSVQPAILPSSSVINPERQP